MMTNINAIVAIYKSHAEAEAGIKELQRSGFDMKKLSIIGRDHHMNELINYYNTGDHVKHWGKLEVSWGGIARLFFSSGLFLGPGMNPLFVAGPLIGEIVGALESAAVVGGLGARGTGLYSISIPKNNVSRYETALKTGKFVVIAHSSVEQATRARDIIGRGSPERLEERQMPFANQEPDIVGAVLVGVGGLDTVGTGLCSLGVPRDSVPRYETALQTGKFVVIAHSTMEQATRARDIISRIKPEILEEHQPRVNWQRNHVAR
jgi:hypothetical protein